MQAHKDFGWWGKEIDEKQIKPMLIPNECLNFFSRQFSTKKYSRIDFYVPFHLMCIEENVYAHMHTHTYRHHSVVPMKSMTSWQFCACSSHTILYILPLLLCLFILEQHGINMNPVRTYAHTQAQTHTNTHSHCILVSSNWNEYCCACASVCASNGNGNVLCVHGAANDNDIILTPKLLCEMSDWNERQFICMYAHSHARTVQQHGTHFVIVYRILLLLLFCSVLVVVVMMRLCLCLWLFDEIHHHHWIPYKCVWHIFYQSYHAHSNPTFVCCCSQWKYKIRIDMWINVFLNGFDCVRSIILPSVHSTNAVHYNEEKKRMKIRNAHFHHPLLLLLLQQWWWF